MHLGVELELPKAPNDEEQNRSYIRRLINLSKQHQGEADIVGPWSDKISLAERARICFEIFQRSYQGTYSFVDFIPTIEELIQLYRKQQFLTWLVYWERHPVGMANIEIGRDGVASLASSVELPSGTRLGIKRFYRGEAKISAAMYLRIAELLGHPQLGRTVWAIEGDVRMTADLVFSNGVSLPGGARSQHINRLCELNPLLICVPRYHLHNASTAPIQQLFMQSRKYLSQDSLNISECIYSPLKHSGSAVLIPDIVKVTFPNAQMRQPEFIDECSKAPIGDFYCHIENDGNVHFSTIHVSGEVSRSFLRRTAEKGLKRSRFVEFILPNRAGNIQLQKNLLDLGAVPLGVLPRRYPDERGIINRESTIHYGIMRRSAICDLVKIQMARDYEGTQLQELTRSLGDEWKRRGFLK